MTTLAAPTGNEIQNTLAATYERGTDTDITLTDGADFPNSAHVIRISESSTKWCLVIYTTKATHVLTMGGGADDYALANNYVTDGTAVFAIGSTVELVCAADEIAQLFTDQALRLSADAVVVDHTLVRGDGGARGTQDTGIAVDDSDNMAFPNAAYVSIDKVRARDGDGLSLQDDGGHGPFIADGGSMVNASQPSFQAHITTSEVNATGDGTAWLSTNGASNWTEIFDRGGVFDGDGTFTAPVDGLYILTAQFYFQELASSHTRGNARFVTSNITIFCADANPWTMAGSTTWVLPFAVITWMDANDTATLYSAISNGTKVIDINNNTYFCAALLS